jgi:hypothetical protein
MILGKGYAMKVVGTFRSLRERCVLESSNPRRNATGNGQL